MADAYTRIADAIVPSVYAQYSFEEHVQSLEIYQAGILFSDPAIASKLSMGGRSVDMPGWKDLGNDPSEPVNDDPADSIEMKKIGSRREVAAVIGDVVGHDAFQDAEQGQLVGALPVFGLAAYDQLLRIVAGKDRGEIRNAPCLGADVAGGDLAARADLLHLDGIGRIVIDRLGRVVAEVLPAGMSTERPPSDSFDDMAGSENRIPAW